MRNLGASLAPSIPLKWVAASCVIICHGALIFGLAVQVPSTKRMNLGLEAAASSPGTDSPGAGPATFSRREFSFPRAVADHYGKLPLAFEPNWGQLNDQVKFLARGNGYTLFLTPREAVFALRRPSTGKLLGRPAGSASFADSAREARNSPNESQPVEVLHVNLVGSSATTSFSGQDELPGKSNYLIGSRPENWHTNIPNYRKVAEYGAYPGIDLVYYGSQRQLECDLVIAPGANPRVIQFAFQGAQELHIDPQGDLIASIQEGELRLHKPIAYQEVDGSRHTVLARYVLKGTHNVAFQVGAYDASRTLVIDPILSYSTYLGGSDIDVANAIAVAPDGSAFIAGGTFSSDFPTAHALQPNAGGPRDFPKDAFVTKLSADGSTLLYSTFLGGENEDVANGIAVDSFGEAYVTGTTFSPHFPVTAPTVNPLCGGDGSCGATFNKNGLIVSNGFISKLNAAGTALVYSTFIGEYEHVHCLAIAVDNNQIAYVTGEVTPNGVPDTNPPTPPPPFPITASAFQPTFGGGTKDVFVMKISATGQSILYSSYLGGGGEDDGFGIAVDSSANAYVTGLTYSMNFPVTPGALQAGNAGAADAFLSKVNTNLSGAASLVYSTFFGGNGLDQGNGVAVDSGGNAYVTGFTNSVTLGFTPPPGAFQTNCKLDSVGVCEADAFVAKLNPALSGPASLVYFTYLGGSGADSGEAIAVDTGGNAYVTGSTVSTDFPIAGSAFQTKFGGGNADAFVTKLNPAGSALVYSTYLGGLNTDTGNGIAVDTAGSAYVAGQTCSLDFPLANPEQSTPGGNCDAFVSKVSILTGIALNPSGLVFPSLGVGATSPPQTVTLTNGVSPLNITRISIDGTNAGDFTETNTCGTSLPAGGQCVITVTFTPTATGIRRASVTITDSAPGSPHIVNLTGGIGLFPDFTVSASPTTATVSAGQAAKFTLSISPVSGFAQQVTLSCSGVPAAASCSISPNAVTPSGTTPSTATVTVSTGTRTVVPPSSRIKLDPFHLLPHFARPWLLWLIIFLILASISGLRRQRATAALGLAVALLLLSVACGGGTRSDVPAGTPAGAYQIAVTGTSGSLTHTTVLTLQVN